MLEAGLSLPLISSTYDGRHGLPLLLIHHGFTHPTKPFFHKLVLAILVL